MVYDKVFKLFIVAVAIVAIVIVIVVIQWIEEEEIYYNIQINVLVFRWYL